MAIDFPLAAGDFARATKTDVSSNTTLGLSKPTNVADGELMIFIVSSNDVLNPSSISISGSYWTLIGENYTTQNGNTGIHEAWYWARWHTGDATSWTATFGADIRDDETYVQRVTGNISTGNPIGAVSSFPTGNSTEPVSPSITTTVNNSAVVFCTGGRNGNNLNGEDTHNPVGTTLIQNKRTRANSSGLCSGIAYEIRPTTGATGARTWPTYFTTSSIWTAFAFEILPEPPLQTITDINSGGDVSGDTSGNTFTTTGFTESITDVTVGSLECTSVSETAGSGTFTVPPPVHGEVYPELGISQDVVISGSTESATLAKNFVLDGYTITSLVDPEIVDLTYPTANFDVTPVTDDLMCTVSADVTPFDDGEIITDAAKTTLILHWVRDTGVMYIYSFTINAEGDVVSNNGLTAIGLTAIGLTQVGLTVRSL